MPIETWAELFDAVATPQLVGPGKGITPVFPKKSIQEALDKPNVSPYLRLGRGLDQITCTATLANGVYEALAARYTLRNARMGYGYQIVGQTRNSLWTRLLGQTILIHEGRKELRIDYHPERQGKLCPLDKAVERFAQFANGLSEVGFETVGPWVVNRYDVALDLMFFNTEVGKAYLDALYRLRYTKGRKVEWRREGEWLQISGRGKRSVAHGRAYDKGLETAAAEAGRWIRVEAVRQYAGAGERPQLVTLTPGAMRAYFNDVYLDACPGEGMKLDTRRYAMTLADLVETGTINRRQYETLAGYLLAERAGTVTRVYPAETARRLAQESRRLGIPRQSSEPPDGLSLDLYALLREFSTDGTLAELA